MPKTTPAPTILVDGSSYLYRAFYASQRADMRTTTGLPTGATRVVHNMLRSLMQEYPHSPIAVIFDAPGKTFRDALYSEYKAHRSPMPEDLKSQVQPIHELVTALGLHLLIEPHVEADDVIGTLAREAVEAGKTVIISTGDKDMAQLVNPHVTLIDTMKNAVTDTQAVIEKYGLSPASFIDYLALVGDKSDNIPGMPKCGDKTARAVLDAFKTIEGIAANLNEIATLSFTGAKTFAKRFNEYQDQIQLSKELATIKCDVPLTLHAGDLARAPLHIEELTRLYSTFEFKSLLDKLQKTTPEPTTEPASGPNYEVILTQAHLDKWLTALKQCTLFAFDTETTSLNYMHAEIVGVSFAINAGHAAYLPVAHDYPDAPKQLDRDAVLAQLKPILEDPKIAKVGQNFKYDYHVLQNYGIELQGLAFDTMLESYVLNPTATRHDMDSLASYYLNQDTIHYEDVAGKGAKQVSFQCVTLEKAVPYAAEDADITLRLHQHLWPKIQQNAQLATLFTDLEMPLVKTLAKMERIGVKIDPKQLATQSVEFADRIKALSEEAYLLAGESFNLASTKQLGHILFEKLGLPVLKKTPKGAPSTAEDVLQDLAMDYELPAVILEYRTLTKLKTTYIDKLPQMLNEQTLRLHTSYHQAVTATGRLSSSDPNLQNIPVKNEEGRRIRQAFVAQKGYTLLAADYSQIELRIMAHLSQDEGLLHAFAQGEDIHSSTAAEIFGIPRDEVDSEQRRNAKAINFGLIYGMSAFGLARQLHISRKAAQHYMDCYFERFPGVLDYMERTREHVSQTGYVETLLGRRLYLPDIHSRNQGRRKGAERAAINAPMQGTAADIIKAAMLHIAAWIAKQPTGAIRMMLQVHDELVFEVRDDFIDTAKQHLPTLMAQALTLDVPLLVDIGTGPHWDAAH